MQTSDFEVMVRLPGSEDCFGFRFRLNFHAEVTKMTIAFMIASEVHSRKVKKEFSLLRESIDHVAAVTENRFRSFDERLARIESAKEQK